MTPKRRSRQAAGGPGVGRRRFRMEVERLEGRALLATLYVDASNHTGVEDGTQAHPYSHIQAAVNASPSGGGGTVRVAAGTYAEALVIARPVVLLGPNAGVNPVNAARAAEAVVVPPVNNPDGGVAVLVTVNNVTIDGLTIDGHNPALAGGTSLNGVTSNAASGVSNVNTLGKVAVISGLTVQNDVIQNFGLFGVIADINDFSTSKHAISTGNAIRNNRIDNVPGNGTIPGRGVSIEDDFYADVTGNLITRATTGIQAIFMLDPSGSATPAAIAANEVHAYALGIYLWTIDSGTAAFSVSGNAVSAESGASAASVGIELDRVLGSSGVSLTGNNASGLHVGVELQYVPTTRTVVVSGGVIDGCDVGVLLTNSDAPSAGALPSRASLAGVAVRGARVAGLSIADARGVATTLSVDAATVVAGSARGATLSGSGAALSDAGAPSLSLTAVPPQQGAGSSASFGYAASDNVTSAGDLVVRYALDGGAASPVGASPLVLSGLASGPHAIVLSAADQAGNVTSVSYSWNVAAPTAPAALDTLAIDSSTSPSLDSSPATPGPTTDSSVTSAPSSPPVASSPAIDGTTSEGPSPHILRNRPAASRGGKAHRSKHPAGPLGKFRGGHKA